MSDDKKYKFEKSIKIAKYDTDERIVTGIVLEPEVPDLQNEIYSESVIQKAMYDYMKDYQQIGIMHKTISPDSYILENYQAPVDFELNGEPIKKGTWLMTVKVMNDGVWLAIKEGRLTGFSIGGYASGHIEELSNE